MNLLTKVHIKHQKRAHPDWTDEQLLEDARRYADKAGPFPDTVTLLDVKVAVASMPENRPGMLL